MTPLTTPPPDNRPALAKTPSALFAETREQRRFPAVAVGIAALAIVALLAALMIPGRRHSAAASPHTLQPTSAYAMNLPVSGLAMSESTSLSGGKSTYLDGRITNRGMSTVIGVTVQVVFANDTSMSPQIETLPLTLIRTREPYVDTEPVSAAPIEPGKDSEFRLIFENLNGNWNGQTPEIRVTGVTIR